MKHAANTPSTKTLNRREFLDAGMKIGVSTWIALGIVPAPTATADVVPPVPNADGAYEDYESEWFGSALVDGHSQCQNREAEWLLVHNPPTSESLTIPPPAGYESASIGDWAHHTIDMTIVKTDSYIDTSGNLQWRTHYIKYRFIARRQLFAS